MSKPINVEAQRVQKVVYEATDKLTVLSMLNQEFFEEIRSKKDEHDVIAHFGPRVGKLIWKHAILEDKFNSQCVENGQLLDLNDEDDISQIEARQIKIDLRESTSKLVREFSNKENQLKLKAFDHKANEGEFSAFLDTFKNLKNLMTVRLQTPLEEVLSNKESVKTTEQEIQIKQAIYQTKQQAFTRYVEECSKSEESRNNIQKQLKDTVLEEKSEREKRIQDAEDQGMKDIDALQASHTSQVEQLEKALARLDADFKKIKKQNMDDEGNLRKEYKKKMDEFHSNMGQYDTEIQASVLDNSRCQADYEEVAADLRNVKEEYELMVEERRKRDEIAAILKKKNDELNAKQEKLARASEYIQAHWRGMLARKEMEKARKGKKKKKKKK